MFERAHDEMSLHRAANRALRDSPSSSPGEVWLTGFSSELPVRGDVVSPRAVDPSNGGLSVL
jgi:hypothetical protein